MHSYQFIAALALAGTLLAANANTNAQSACAAPPAADSESLVRLALTCNPGQLALEARVDAQAERAAASGHLDDPRLMLGAAPRTFGNDQLPDGYIVELNQSLPWPGVLQLRRALQQAGADGRAFATLQRAVELALGVRLAYADRHYREQLLAINRRHRDLWQTFVASSRARYAAGQGGKSAVLQAEHEGHQLLVEEIALQQALARDNSRLARLANLAPGALPTSSQLPRRELPADALKLALENLSAQPELRRLAAERERAASALALAEKDRYPNFSLLARHNNLWVNPDQRLFFGVGVNLPLDLGGKRSARERSLAAEQLAVEWQREDSALVLEDTLRQAQSRHREARESLELYQQKLLPLAEESLASARDEFASGSGDFLSLLVAERNLLQVEKAAQAAVRDRFAALAQITAAAGLVMLDDWQQFSGGSK